MKFSPTLLAVSCLLAILGPAVARADDVILSFDTFEPPPVEAPQPVAAAPPPMVLDHHGEAIQPLPIPPGGGNPPMRYHSPQQLPAGVYRRGVAAALNQETTAAALLPPAPPVPDHHPLAVAAAVEPEPKPEQQTPEEPVDQIILSFDVAAPAPVHIAQAEPEPEVLPSPEIDPILSLFEQDSDSLVAIAVGSAEGTRTPAGTINPAYFGHTDPGNRAWNMGTFSYQHGANSPAEADRKQLNRLKSQTEVLKRRALSHGMNLTLEETLNGIDLANQSPLAAIGRVGYIERLAEAKANGYDGAKAIVVARTRSYINPNTNRWNAPGLGNTEASITRDQQRRADAVAAAIAAYQQRHGYPDPHRWTMVPDPDAPATTVAEDPVDSPEASDIVFQVWTDDGQPDDQPQLAQADESEPTEDTVHSQGNDDKLDDELAALAQVDAATADQSNRPVAFARALATAIVGAPPEPQRQAQSPGTDDPLTAIDLVEDGAAESPVEEMVTPGEAPQVVPDPNQAIAEASAAKPPQETSSQAATTAQDQAAASTQPPDPASVSTAEIDTIPGARPDTAVYLPGVQPVEERAEPLSAELEPTSEALVTVPGLTLDDPGEDDGVTATAPDPAQPASMDLASSEDNNEQTLSRDRDTDQDPDPEVEQPPENEQF
ncbi:MAG: hypothetical protein EA342_03765 [Leptolyngbya sp. LCM1.Bin17]|nr:MAG: hypothetical protein EA342_03765 [Leptolyngbya sp. LCM1.Bin17]